MKRTLLEILAGMAVLVLLASLSHQISRLKIRDHDVASLRDMVRQAMTRVDDQISLKESRRKAVVKLNDRVEQLEAKLAEASATDEATRELRQELVATRLEADRFKTQIARDVSRTKELVDAYHKEFRALDRKASAVRSQTQNHLQNLTERFLPDPNRLSKEILAPTVQLNGEDTVGSGTLVYSGPGAETDEVETYVLTSYHVVRNILADSDSAERRGISVTIYAESGPVEERADMIGHDDRIDAAILKLRSNEKYDDVASAIPQQQADKIRVWQHIYAVGCPLGNDPIPTKGEISSIKNPLNGSNYWMINAPTYFGNSGGGVYLAESRQLIGVFSKIYTHGRGNPVVVPHMGLCTPIVLIHEWLAQERLAFVLDPEAPRPVRAEDLAVPAGK